MFDSAMRRAGLEFVIDCAPLPEPVYVDREMWAKIVLNLLSNALKATFTGSIDRRSCATSTVRRSSRSRDTGIGIPPAEQQRLFERFHRVSGAALRTHEGSGIGLALVAELAALHGGAVAVHSTPGAGSTFTVRIPYGHAPPAGRAGRARDARRAAVRRSRYSVGYLAEALPLARRRPTPTSPRSDAADQRPRVLVVDDNADMRDYVSGLLAADYAVRTAADGVAGAGARPRRPARPGADRRDDAATSTGSGCSPRCAPTRTTMHIPVVMLSARAGDDATVEGLEAGADDYLVKPFSARELLARVRANLELDRVRRLADELARSRALLDQAEELAQVGSWEIDLRDDAIAGSTEYFAHPRSDRRALAGDRRRRRRCELVHPDDRGRAAAALDRLRTTRPSRSTSRCGCARADGEPAGARAGPRARRTATARRPLARGSVQDITEQRNAEQAIDRGRRAAEAAGAEHAHRRRAAAQPAAGDALRRRRALDVATYYRAGVEGTQVGGDWYDVIELGAGRTALVIGDVMGRGVRAAAVMGQLRAAVRAYARLDLPPAELLRLLDDVGARARRADDRHLRVRGLRPRRRRR